MVERVDEEIRIQVKDDGVGLEEEKRRDLLKSLSYEKPVGSYGLYNVHQRVLLYYGSSYGITMESKVLEGTTVTIHLPFEKGEEDNA